MWDNRATMHRGRPWPGNEPRYMVRTTILGDRGGRPRNDASAGARGG
jgi:alpha-ketoglutarate-dependent taurine dioxygenase